MPAISYQLPVKKHHVEAEKACACDRR